MLSGTSDKKNKDLQIQRSNFKGSYLQGLNTYKSLLLLLLGALAKRHSLTFSLKQINYLE